MKRRSSLVKFILVLVATAIGLFASFAGFPYKSPGGNVWNFNGFLRGMEYDIDLGGGITAIYEAKSEDLDDSDMNGVLSRFASLLSEQDYDDARISREGSSRVRVSVPEVYDPDEIFTATEDSAELAFYISEDGAYSPDDTLIFRGDVIDNAYAVYVGGAEGYAVNLVFDKEGASILEEETESNIESYMLICETSGGEVTSTISAAQIGEKLTGGQMSITRTDTPYTAETAQDLANRILSGTFDVPLVLVSCSVTSAEDAAAARAAGLASCLAVLVVAIALMCVFYRMMGMVAGISSLIFTVLTLFILAVFPPVIFSVSGIAGVLLAFALMTAGNIITFEKIKDEYRNGKSVLAAYFTGVKKSLPPVADINVLTAVAALMLLIFGTGTVSGFGLVLLIGTIISAFTSLIVTRFMLKWTMAIWGSKDPEPYALKRRPGFDEANEEQYVPKPKRERRKPAVVTEDGIAVEVDPDAEQPREEEGDASEDKPAGNAKSDDFDELFGSFDGGDKK